MAQPWNEKPAFPDLRNLNGGQEFKCTGIAYSVFNDIVNALIYLRRRLAGETVEGGDENG